MFKTLRISLSNPECDVLSLLNSSPFSSNPNKMSQIVEDIFQEPLNNFSNYKLDEEFQLSGLCTQLSKLGSETEGTCSKLQNKFEKMQLSQTKIPTSSTILMYDSAKTRADKLATLIKAKIDFETAYDGLKLLDKNNDADYYQVLVQLNKCCNILKNYDFNEKTKIDEINLIKIEFLMPFEKNIYEGLDYNDKSSLEMIKNKFISLDCLPKFEEYLTNFFSKQIVDFISQMEQAGQTEDISASNPDAYIWKILNEMFELWRRTWEMVDGLDILNDNTNEVTSSNKGSAFVSNIIYTILTSKTQWNIMTKLFINSLSSEEEKFMAYLQISKQFTSFIDLVHSRGDDDIHKCLEKVIEKLMEILGETYQREAKNFLLSEISKIVPPENAAARHKHKWIIPYIEDLQRIILQIIHESYGIFGKKFYNIIFPSIDSTISELTTVLHQKDYLEVKKDINQEICANKSIGEITEEKFNSIIVVGYIYSMIETICDIFKKTMSDIDEYQTIVDDLIVKNSEILIQKLSSINTYVVNNKIMAIGNAIILKMSKEISSFVKEKENKVAISQKLNISYRNKATSLPKFSFAPQDYMTNLGQSFLQVVNTVTVFLSNINFKLSIEHALKSGSRKSEQRDGSNNGINKRYIDLWLINNITENVVHNWTENFHDTSESNDVDLMKQVFVDAKFLIDVIVDLNLEPSTELLEICDNLSTIIEQGKE
uniref:Conserved oligomeric Golgi complex subunit 7 n=1 Tax=Parastrongyloides trichosuri TaxID=131310 RepID=A0A0N4Z798_PARTI